MKTDGIPPRLFLILFCSAVCSPVGGFLMYVQTTGAATGRVSASLLAAAGAFYATFGFFDKLVSRNSSATDPDDRSGPRPA